MLSLGIHDCSNRQCVDISCLCRAGGADVGGNSGLNINGDRQHKTSHNASVRLGFAIA